MVQKAPDISASANDMADELIAADKYEGMFSGVRIGGMPTVKQNIIGEELDMLERGSRPVPSGYQRIAPGPKVQPPRERATKEAAEMRATLRATRRPSTSVGFVGR